MQNYKKKNIFGEGFNLHPLSSLFAVHCSFCVQPSILKTQKESIKKKLKLHTRSVMCSIAERMKACRELRFLLMRVLSVLTIVLRKSETFTVRLRITYNQYMHHRETETGYHAALCADKRSSLCKRRRVLKMPSPRMPGNWSVDPCGCPPASASLQHILQLCAWRVGANAFRTVMDACVL